MGEFSLRDSVISSSKVREIKENEKVQHVLPIFGHKFNDVIFMMMSSMLNCLSHRLAVHGQTIVFIAWFIQQALFWNTCENKSSYLKIRQSCCYWTGIYFLRNFSIFFYSLWNRTRTFWIYHLRTVNWNWSIRFHVMSSQTMSTHCISWPSLFSFLVFRLMKQKIWYLLWSWVSRYLVMWNLWTPPASSG